MEQLLLHMVGDYITQSHRMANEKTKSWFWAVAHSLVYGLPFLLIAGWQAVAVIVVTHAVIDRLRLVRYVIFVKNWLNDTSMKWESCSGTGYDKEVPAWLSVWLMIIADNTLHVVINYLAVRYLG
jgi:hypothetical protein